MATSIHFKTNNFLGRHIALVIPPSPFLLNERVFVSLGVLRVAASLEAQGVQVGVLDLSGVANYTEVIISFLRQHKFDWIGLTATTPQLPAAVKIASVIRQIDPNLRIALGGPHVTLSYSAQKFEFNLTKESKGRAANAVKILEAHFDVLVAGDGEYAVFELFKKDCPKLIDGDDNKGPFFMSNAQYESLPMPARHLVKMDSYKYQIDGFPATSLIAQLGCPFHCGFCGGRNSKSLRFIRTRSTESILKEIRWLYENYGYTGFMFYDDELNVNKGFLQLLEKITELQRILNIKFQLRGFVKAELFNEAQAEAMVRAGFKWLLCGFESAHPRILKNIEKIATVEDNTRAVQAAKKYGLKVKALMSIGHPGESRETILQSKDWLIDMQVDDFDCTVITTYPGTPYYDLAIKNPDFANVWTYTQKKTGDRLHAYDVDFMITPDYYKGDPNGGYKSYVFTDYLSAQEIVALRNQLEAEVRMKLKIPFYPASAAILYEHSMGQGLPELLFKNTHREHQQENQL